MCVCLCMCDMILCHMTRLFHCAAFRSEHRWSWKLHLWEGGQHRGTAMSCHFQSIPALESHNTTTNTATTFALHTFPTTLPHIPQPPATLTESSANKDICGNLTPHNATPSWTFTPHRWVFDDLIPVSCSSLKVLFWLFVLKYGNLFKRFYK